MDATAYLSSLGIEVVEATRPAIGRLALAGEFLVGTARGVLLRPKRGGVSDRYLELLSGEGYEFVIVDAGNYPSFYARDGEGLAPVRALPIQRPEHFPSQEVLAAWARLIRAAAERGNAAEFGVAQLVACLDNNNLFGPDLVRPNSGKPDTRIGGNKSASAEPLRTAAALLAGFRIRPESPDETVSLVAAVSSLHRDKRQFAGLTENLVPLVRLDMLGARRLLVSGGAGAELAALHGAAGTIVLPTELRVLGPLLERILPNAALMFADFLQSTFERPHDDVVVVPPLGLKLSGVQFGRFELAKRNGKARTRVAAELLYVEHALTTMADGALLVTVLPEGFLSSAGHAGFREWLLEHAQLLAVVSLPAGTCFHGTGVKCSVVLLRKPAIANDYPVLMIDVEADDLGDDVEAARSALVEFLAREVTPCA